MLIAVSIHNREKAGFGKAIDLVDQQNHLAMRAFKNFEDKTFASAKGYRAIQQMKHEVNVVQTVQRCAHHALVHPVAGFVNSGRVDKDDLTACLRDDSEYAVARRLRFLRDDGDLLPDQSIEE